MEKNLKKNTYIHIYIYIYTDIYIYIYIYTDIHILILFAIHLKLAQHCKLTRTNFFTWATVGIGIIYFSPCMCSCSVAQLCPTLCNPMDCSQSGSSVQGIFQARVLEWVAISSSKGSSWSRDQTHVSWSPVSPVLGGRFFTAEPLGKPVYMYIFICVCIHIHIYIYMHMHNWRRTHSSVLAWRIPGMEESSWLPSMGSQSIGRDLAAAAAYVYVNTCAC